MPVRMEDASLLHSRQFKEFIQYATEHSFTITTLLFLGSLRLRARSFCYIALSDLGLGLTATILYAVAL